MKKVSALVTGWAISLLVLSGSAAAQTSTISNTGPGSTNAIENTQQCDINTTNNNNVNVGNNNQQNSQSGNSSGSGNTTGGGSQSGSTGNNNSTGVGVDINNDSNKDCPSPAPRPTPSPAPTPQQPAPAPVVSSAVTTAGGRGAATLPKTGTVNYLLAAGIASLSLGTIGTAARLGLLAYRLRTIS